MTTNDLEFLRDVAAEVRSARRKFPNPNLSFAALVEEVGEIAKALLSEDWKAVSAECVQAATMALRVAVEGDPSLSQFREASGLDYVGAVQEHPAVDLLRRLRGELYPEHIEGTPMLPGLSAELAAEVDRFLGGTKT